MSDLILHQMWKVLTMNTFVGIIMLSYTQGFYVINSRIVPQRNLAVHRTLVCPGKVIPLPVVWSWPAVRSPPDLRCSLRYPELRNFGPWLMALKVTLQVWLSLVFPMSVLVFNEHTGWCGWEKNNAFESFI